MTRLIYEVDSPFSDTVLEDEVRKRTPRLFRFRRDSGCDTPLESLSLVAQGGTLSVPPRGPKTSFRAHTRVAKPRSCSENYHDMHTLQTSSAGLWPWRARKSVIKLPTFGGQSGSRCALESARAASFGAQNYCCCCHMLSNWAATCRGTPGWRTYQRGTPRTCRYFLANKNTRQWRKIELPKSLIIRLTLVVILLSEEAANSRRERKWPLTDRCVTLTAFLRRDLTFMGHFVTKLWGDVGEKRPSAAQMSSLGDNKF